MAVTLDTANIVSVANQGVNPVTLNAMCGAAVNRLLAAFASDQSSAGAPPTAFTYNGVGLNFIGHHLDTFGFIEDVSWWYMDLPPTG
jgi:hypothetical protein